MPIRILPVSEKRKAKRGQTKGGAKWPKRPYKDYTKLKHTNLIQTLDGRKKGQIQESGAPGTEKKLHDKSMKRLNEIQKLKSKKGTRKDSPGSRKRLKHLQSGKFNIGGRANLLEEVGRLDSEKMNPNRRAEKKRVIGELRKGYKGGSRPRPQGPHTWVKSGKPKLAIKGWK